MTEIRRSAHPRPDRVRAHWQTLNGPWRFRMDRENVGKKQKWYKNPDFPLTIQVPFAYQAPLSGVSDEAPADVVWYAREFVLPASMAGERPLLHFGAVDYRADVWLDGQYLGGHTGGYTPFSFDLSDLTVPGDTCMLVVRCEDRPEQDQPRGKQSWREKPFSCWYTPVTGIWQSVWLEGVGACYAQDFRLTPRLENLSLQAEITFNEAPAGAAVRLTAAFQGKTVARQEAALLGNRVMRMDVCLRPDETLEGVHLWSPERPELYDLTIETLVDGEVCDRVDTYFGMRSISVDGNHILLNRRILYQRLVLDQGYWRDGLLTAPDDEALKRDVELTRALGYNGARKHQKLEDPQYLYWADHLGLLVWGELPSAYRLDDREKRRLIRDFSEAIQRDYSHPSLIIWTPLNESWGVPFIHSHAEAQRLADALCALARSLDGTRLVSGNDGWEQANTDLVTVHDYTARPDQLSPDYQDAEAILRGGPGAGRMIAAQGYRPAGKPMLMTEYGGIAMNRDAGGANWGYNGMEDSEESFLKRFEAITLAFRRMPVFCGFCYTQLTDVFQEVNGLLDMERRPKADVNKIREINLSR